MLCDAATCAIDRRAVEHELQALQPLAMQLRL